VETFGQCCPGGADEHVHGAAVVGVGAPSQKSPLHGPVDQPGHGGFLQPQVVGERGHPDPPVLQDSEHPQLGEGQVVFGAHLAQHGHGHEGCLDELDNNTGDIRAAGITGDTRLQDSFGTISVTGLAAADVVVRNNTGDISLTFTKVPRQVNVTDSFGDITLVLPPGPATYRVVTGNSFGSTTVSVPQSPTARNVITASNNSGNITIITQKGHAVTHAHPAPPSPPAGPGAAQ
jgi:hypothetical protein